MTVRLIDYIRERCRMDGDCWLWRLSLNRYGYPVMRTHSYGIGTVMRVLKSPPEGMRVRNTCGERTCCNPDHWQIAKPGTIVREQYTQGRRVHVGVSARKGHLSRKTRKGGYAEAEQARRMVSEGKSFDEVAEHFGIDPLTARRWATGRMWNRSPWAI